MEMCNNSPAPWKKTNGGGQDLALPDLKSYYKAAIFKRGDVGTHKQIRIDWSPKKKFMYLGDLTQDKEGISNQWAKDEFFMRGVGTIDLRKKN